MKFGLDWPKGTQIIVRKPNLDRWTAGQTELQHPLWSSIRLDKNTQVHKKYSQELLNQYLPLFISKPVQMYNLAPYFKHTKCLSFISQIHQQQYILIILALQINIGKIMYIYTACVLAVLASQINMGKIMYMCICIGCA